MSDRPKRLYYTGDGSRFFAGVPKRDLDERDLARLTDAQVAEITADGPDGKPLYQKTEPAGRKKADKPAEKAETKRETPPAADQAD